MLNTKFLIHSKNIFDCNFIENKIIIMKPFNLLIAFLFASSTLIAQNRNDFNGPTHKNYKPWQHKAKPVVVYNNLELNKIFFYVK